MDTVIAVENLSFTYHNRPKPTLSSISLTVGQGEFVLISGPTGCGKSTLLKTLNGLIPHESGGDFNGAVWIDGQDTRCLEIAELSKTVGMVFQSPDDQLFSSSVEDETAFVLENMGLPAAEIRDRVAMALSMVGLAGKERTSIYALSGGQKQRLAVAAALAAKPKVLVLDEPISQLDPCGAENLLSVLAELNRAYGMTVVIVEHRIHEVLRLCRRVILMDRGRIVWDSPVQAALACPEIFRQQGLRLSQPVDICSKLALQIPAACAQEAVMAIRLAFPTLPRQAAQPLFKTEPVKTERPEVVKINNLCFRYQHEQSPVLNNINLSVGRGEVVALMGTNGAGKSTLLHTICGLLYPESGQVTVRGRISAVDSGQAGMVLQNPDLMLFNRSVTEEIMFGPNQQQKTQQEAEAQLERLLAAMTLTGLEKDFPLALSRGQRLRVAIAAVLACEPAVLLLDEPTTGQDISRIADLLTVIAGYKEQGGAVIFCTHDTEIAAQIADRVVVMHGGRIIADGHPREIFIQADILAEAGLKPPPAVQIACALGAGALTSVEEVVAYVQQASLGSNAG